MKIDIRSNSNYFWRIVFTLLIALLHSYYVTSSTGIIGWYLAVDYFFIISVFLLTNSFFYKRESTGKYILGRIVKLWPHQIFSFGVLLFWFYYAGSLNASLGSTILKHASEIVPFGYFMFDAEFAGGYAYNFPVWYLSVLMLCSLILYFLLDKHEQALKNVIAPVAIVLIYGYMYRSCNSFNTGNNIGVFLNDYYVRGFAGMCVGVMIFFAVRRLQEYSFHKGAFFLFRVSEWFCFGSMILITYTHGGKNDLWWIALMSCGVVFSFLHPSKARGNSKFMRYLSELMYPVFLNHIFVIRILEYGGIRGSNIKNIALYVFVLLVYSMITKAFVEQGVKVITKGIGCLIQQEK